MAATSSSTAVNATGDGDTRVHDHVYDQLAQSLIQGAIPPLKSVSLRSLAADLGVSPMPVREAVRRLIAENALELQAHNKRLRVPNLTEHRMEQLLKARQWVEPELAWRATHNVNRDLIKRLKDDDARLMAALRKGDPQAYMQANQDFHFSIYSRAGAELFHDMARTLWLQIGPFMRVVFDRIANVYLPKDHHQEMIEALSRGDADAVRTAMSADIGEGMALMLDVIRDQSKEETKRRRRT